MLFNKIHFIKTIFILSVVSSVSVLSGCASSSKGDHLIPQEGLTVSQIYAQSGQGESVGSPYGTTQDDDLIEARARAASANTSSASHSPTTVSLQKPTSRFQLISNPSIPIYIYPHLVSMGNDEVPVEGYQTAFFLYSKNHYALPWEHY